MLKMVTPEQVCLTESMQVGQRHLQDAGYSQAADAVEDKDDQSNLSVEQQLAPWITTKNFLFATQAKAMLRLHGEGDPTGRGEAFSFIRISMKDIFVKAGENYEQKVGKCTRFSLVVAPCSRRDHQLRQKTDQSRRIGITSRSSR
jgi:transcription initiation factor TFIID subunit 1